MKLLLPHQCYQQVSSQNTSPVRFIKSLMSAVDGSFYIGPEHFGEMLSRGGIGTGKVGTESNAKVTVHTVSGNAPENFNSGSVMTIKRYEKMTN